AVTRLAGVAGAATNRFDPGRALLDTQHPGALLDHRAIPAPGRLRESAIRSAARGGISPTTVARKCRSSASRRRLHATVGPNWARRSSARLSPPRGSTNRVKLARPSL